MNVQTDPASLEKAAKFPETLEQPIRSNFLPEEKLFALGAALARRELEDCYDIEAFDFQARIREDADKILEVYRATNSAQARGETITPAAQWLLDNNYLVEETIFQIKRDLPRRFYAELPTIKLANGVELPRTLALAWVYVAHSDSMVSADMFKALIDGYQSVEPMRIGELWALPSLLRFVLIENLRRLAARVNRTHDMRQVANDVADRVLAAGDGEARRTILSHYTTHARDTTFATQLLYRLRDGSQNAGRALVWLEDQLEKSGSDAEEIILSEHQTLSSGNVTTGNIIRGLRLLNDVDWTLWFESVSPVDSLLRQRTNFADLDFQSRDQYRAAIEDLARRSGHTEFEVANRAIELVEAGEGADGISPGNDIGFLLVGPKRQHLEREIGYRPPFTMRFKRAFRRTGWLGMAVPVFALTALLLALAGHALASLAWRVRRSC